MTHRVVVDYRMSRSSGIGVYLRQIVRRLATDHGDDLQLELMGGEPVSGLASRPFRAPVYSLAEQVEPLLRLPRATDVYWCPNYNAPLASPGALVVTVHDLCHLAMPEFFRSRVKAAVARAMFANVRRRAARVICVSEFTASELTRLTGIERERIVVINSAIDDRWSTPVQGTRPIPEPYILCVGNVKPHKNVGMLLRAFNLIRDDVPHTLVVIGKREGLITPDHDVLAAADRLGARVSFTGEITDDLLQRYYRHADMLAHPSLYEGFGFPPLEAMAAGIPVAASRASSIPEICGDAVAYFDPRDAENMAAVITTVLTDESLRLALRDRGRAKVSEYSWARTTAQHASVFREAATA